MSRGKIICTSLVVVMMILVTASLSQAVLRVVIRPWWPRAIVIGAPYLVPLYRAPVPDYYPPVPMPPQPVKIGFVDLDVNPSDVDVFVDGVYRGKAGSFSGNPDYLSLTEGQHSISLSKKGYRTESLILNISDSRLIALDVELDTIEEGKDQPQATYQLDLQQTGSIVLKVDPPDASLYVDGNFYGIVTQFAKKKGTIVLRAGDHRLEVARPGYRTYAGTFNVQNDEVQEIDIKLEKEN